MKKRHLTTLYIIRRDGTTASYPSNHNYNLEKGIAKLKNILLNTEKGRWEIAYLYDAQMPKGTAPLCAFHPSSKTDELTKEEAEQLRFAEKQANQRPKKYRGYCVPTLAQQIKGAKPYTIYIADINEARTELDRERLYKVIIYSKKNEIIEHLTA